MQHPISRSNLFLSLALPFCCHISKGATVLSLTPVLQWLYCLGTIGRWGNWFSEYFRIYSEEKFLATVGLMALENPEAALPQLVAVKIEGNR